MRIGCGVLTYSRPQHLALFQRQLRETNSTCELYIADDSTNRRGVAYRSNEILRWAKEKDFDYLFIFNDDCFPITEGWAEFFIVQSKVSEEQHFLYLMETPQMKKVKWDYEYSILGEYNNCSGVFMFITKEVIEKVGAFDERFGIYGFEHANYSQRVHMAGLTKKGKYLCPVGANYFLYAMDLQSDREFNKAVNHKSSLKPKEALEHIAKGQEHYNKVITEIYLPL